MRVNSPARSVVFEPSPKKRLPGIRHLAVLGGLCIGGAVLPTSVLAVGPPDREATAQLIITEVETVFDYTNGDTLIIRGENFDKGSPAIVTLGGFGELDVLTESATEIVVSCPAPDYVCTTGDYRLSVTAGDKKDDSDVYALTIGAVGPQGPAGEDGEPGASGVAAAGAGLVGTGTPENLTLSVDYPNLVTPSGIRIESTGDAVRVSANSGSVVISPDGSIRIESRESIDVVSSVGNVELRAPLGRINMNANSMSFKSGSSELRIDPAGVSLNGSLVKIDGGNSVDVKAPATKVQGDALLNLKGGLVSIN